jgi:hypothetical protein
VQRLSAREVSNAQMNLLNLFSSPPPVVGSESVNPLTNIYISWRRNARTNKGRVRTRVEGFESGVCGDVAVLGHGDGPYIRARA